MQAAPAKVTLRLSEAVVPSSVKAALTDGNGRTVPVTAVNVVIGAGAQSPNLIPSRGQTAVPTAVVLDLPVLPPDVYHLAWQTLSADDLHVTSGVIVFGVQRDAGGAIGQVDDPWPGPFEVLLRWGQLLAVGLAVGTGSLALVSGDRGAPSRRLHLWGAVAAGSAVAVQLLLLVAQGAAAGGSPTALLSGGYGLRWFARVALLLAMAAWHGVAIRRASAWADSRRGLAGFGLVLVVGQALAAATLGHAGTAGPIQLTLTTAHTSAVQLWVGSVGAVLVSLLVGDLAGKGLRGVMPGVSRLSAACLAVVAVTGIALAARSVASVDAALMSTYGRELLVKVVLVVVAVLLAVRTRSWLGRLRSEAEPPSGSELRRPLAVEVGVLVAVLALAASLASSRPALGTEWDPASDVQPLASGQVEDLVETVTVSPNRPGRNFVTVDVFETRRPSPGPVQQVLLTARRPDGSAQQVVLQPKGEGRWLAATDVLNVAGGWQLQVVAKRPDLPDASADYAWVVADPTARLKAPVVSSAPVRGVLDALALTLGAVILLTSLGLWWRRRRPRSGPPDGDDTAPGGRPASDRS